MYLEHIDGNIIVLSSKPNTRYVSWLRNVCITRSHIYLDHTNSEKDHFVKVKFNPYLKIRRYCYGVTRYGIFLSLLIVVVPSITDREGRLFKYLRTMLRQWRKGIMY